MELWNTYMHYKVLADKWKFLSPYAHDKFSTDDFRHTFVGIGGVCSPGMTRDLWQKVAFDTSFIDTINLNPLYRGGGISEKNSGFLAMDHNKQNEAKTN